MFNTKMKMKIKKGWDKMIIVKWLSKNKCTKIL